MQSPRERRTGVHPPRPCDGDRLPSPAEEPASHFLFSPRSGGSAPRPQSQQGGCPSRRGFLKKFPFLLKRKKSLSGQAASRSRLCMEDTHESPIQAFRKPALQGQPLALDSDDDSLEGKVGPSLLRKLLCLKAKSSKLHQHHWRLGASPLSKAGASCGPVAALSRTADPHGESPLRWKPRVEIQSPPETGSVTEPEKTGDGSSPGASCATKPWKTFRALMSSRAKKGSVLPENEQDRRAIDGDLHLSAGSPATHVEKSTREPPRDTVAAGDKNPQMVFLSDEEGICRTRKENESPRTAQPGLEIRERTGDISELDSIEDLSSFGEEFSHPQEDMDVLQRQGRDFSGVSVGDADGGSTEDIDPDQEVDRYWEEAMAGGDLDLADLAENPGGQGMVIGTRDLSWLTSEALGGSTVRPAFALINHDSCHSKEENVITEFITPKFHKEVMMTTGAASAEADGDCAAKMVPTDQQGSLEPSAPCKTSGACTLEESGPPFPCFLQDLDLLTSPTRHPSLSAREQDPPVLQPSSRFNTALASQLQGSHTMMAQPGPESYKASVRLVAPEDAQSKQRLYRAAAEIVGAAIDAAAEQLAQKETRAWGPEDDNAGDPVPRAATQGAEETL